MKIILEYLQVKEMFFFSVFFAFFLSFMSFLLQ